MRSPNKRQTLKLLRDRRIPVETVLDVGVQHGTPELLDAYPDRKHILFEPVAEYRNAIELAYRATPHEIVTAAISDAVGTTEIVTNSIIPGMDISHAWVAKGHEVDGTHTIVPMTTLDCYLAEHPWPGPYFLKIDVDGHETQVLCGARTTLAQTSVLMIEATVAELPERLAFISGAGFAVVDLSEPCYYDETLWQVDIIAVRNDINNRMFRHIHRDFDSTRYSIFTG